MDNTAMSSLPRRRSKAGKIFRTFFLLLLFGLAIYFYWKYFFTYSSGNRYGLLQKFSHKGNVFKTYEGEMILSSIRGNNNVALASEKFFFSVRDENVASQLMKMQGKYITVHYKEKNGTLAWQGDTKFIVDSVMAE